MKKIADDIVSFILNHPLEFGILLPIFLFIITIIFTALFYYIF